MGGTFVARLPILVGWLDGGQSTYDEHIGTLLGQCRKLLGCRLLNERQVEEYQASILVATNVVASRECCRITGCLAQGLVVDPIPRNALCIKRIEQRIDLLHPSCFTVGVEWTFVAACLGRFDRKFAVDEQFVGIVGGFAELEERIIDEHIGLCFAAA